jgi:ribonuclease VapC
MIALDTSALIAIVGKEEEAQFFNRLIVENTAVIGTPTLLEAHLVLSSKLEGGPRDFFEDFLKSHAIRPVAFSLNMFEIAQDAFDRYGKGRHPAGLNFGDCLSYAVARFHDVPLLFKGDDFLHTDIVPAYLNKP